MDTCIDVQTDRSPFERLTSRCKALFGSFARKSTGSLIDQAIVSGTNFATTIIIGRMCGAADLGVYSLAFSVVVIIACVQHSLIATPYTVYANRLSGHKRAVYTGSLFVHYVFMAIIMTIVLAAIALAMSFGFGPPGLANVIWILAGLIGLILLREFARWSVIAHLNMAAAVAIDATVAIVQVGGLICLGLTDTLSAMTAYAVVGLGCGISGLGWTVLARKHMVFQWDQVRSEMGRSWALGGWLVGGQVISALRAYVVFWLLAIMISTEATGVFAACATVILFANPFVLGMSNVLAPKIAQGYTEGGAARVRRLVIKATFLLGVVAGTFCLFIVLFGDNIVQFLYDGKEYAGHGLTITLLALQMLVATFTMPSHHGLLVIERSDVDFVACLLGLVTAVVVAILLIGQWQLAGAAAGFLVGTAVGSVIRFVAFLQLSSVRRKERRTT